MEGHFCWVLSILQWRHNERDSISNHQLHDCLLKCLFEAQINETSKLRVTGLCAGNSPVTGEFLAQRTSNTEYVSIWWRHHEMFWYVRIYLLFPSDESRVFLHQSQLCMRSIRERECYRLRLGYDCNTILNEMWFWICESSTVWKGVQMVCNCKAHHAS